MAGLIQTQINQANPFDNISGYEAERVELAPEDTVESRVQKIIDRGGPAQQSEVTRSQQAANRKGLINTSMAVGAGERARYDYSMPIASQDAAASLQTKLANQAATGRASEFTAGQTNLARQQQRSGQQQLESQAAQAAAAERIEKQRAGYQTERDTALSEQQERRDILIGGQVAARDTAASIRQTARDLALSSQTMDRDTALAAIDTAAKKLASELNISEREAAAVLQRDRDTYINTNEKARENSQRIHELKVQGLDATNAEALEVIRGENNKILQASMSASNIMAEHTKAIGSILSNPDIKPDAKQSLVDKSVEQLESSLAVIGGIAGDGESPGIDLTDLLTFTSKKTQFEELPQETQDWLEKGGLEEMTKSIPKIAIAV